MKTLDEFPFDPVPPEVGLGWIRAAKCEAVLRDLCKWHKRYPKDAFYTPEEIARATKEMEALCARARQLTGGNHE